MCRGRKELVLMQSAAASPGVRMENMYVLIKITVPCITVEAQETG